MAETISTKKIFISYSRTNRYIANRLKIDLERAGCVPWFDQHDIKMTDEWKRSIEKAIQDNEYFLYLWSPDANESLHVQYEFRFAQQHVDQARIGIVRVAGKSADMPDELRKIQHADLSMGYWKELPKLLQWLEAKETMLRSYNEIKNSCDSMVAARDLLMDEDSQEWNVWNDDEESWRNFVRIPLTPSGYATSWIVAEKNHDLRPQREMQVVLKFTGGDRARDTVQQVLEYLIAAQPNMPLQVLYIEGPRRDGLYEIPHHEPHVWKDCIDLASNMIEHVCGGKLVHFFFDSPQALVFPIAASLNVQRSFHVYTLNKNAERNEQRYACVYSKT